MVPKPFKYGNPLLTEKKCLTFKCQKRLFYIVYKLIKIHNVIQLLYRVIQEDRSIFWEVIISGIVKKVPINMCLILNVYRHRAVWISKPNYVRFLFVTLDEERSLQNKGGHTDELLARILDAAAYIKKREDQLRRTTRDLRTRVAKCTEVDGGILEHLLWTVTYV
jgi:hypothetical protein